MINADMGMYHVLDGNSVGAVSKKWCNQRNNDTLFDCSQQDSSYMPLANNADKVWNYVRNQSQYYIDVINAFIKMTSVPGDGDSGSYVNFSPAWICEGATLKCAGDIFYQNCAGLTPISCSS